MLNLDELGALCRQTGAELVLNEPMSAHTTFKVGGPCAAMVTLPDIAACQVTVRSLRENKVPFRLIGRGSNLLVPDAGYRGVVLRLGGSLASELTVNEEKIFCAAGVPLKNLCLAALDAGLTGLEFAYGIPGSVGGAVFMNAGAYGGEFSDICTQVRMLDDTGTLRTIPAAEVHFDYRYSIFMKRDWLILGTEVRLQKGDPEEIREKMQELLGRRRDKQPLEFPSAGSTFKRPEGDHASRLIAECGLKGYAVGGAQVSEKHAGFVINRGGATFADIMAVCRYVTHIVETRTGVRLELEPDILRAEDA